MLVTAAHQRDIASPVLTPQRLPPIEHSLSSASESAPTRQAQIASGVTIRCPSDALSVGRLLCQQSHAENVLITLDAEGMALVPAGGKGELIAARTRVVHDATGAGDMVLATLGLCRAGGIALHDAACLANVAAGLQVEKFGIAAISRDDIRAGLGLRPRGRKIVSLEELLSRLQERRRDSHKIVFTNGCFDLLHVGHIRCLEEGRSPKPNAIEARKMSREK